MKKAFIVEYNFMTRVVVDEKDENLKAIVEASKQKMIEKVNNELSENLSEWYLDTECPYDEKVD